MPKNTSGEPSNLILNSGKPGIETQEISIEFDEFRELFLNGCSVFIYAKQRFPNKLYPAWQGMQYMCDMMEGRAVLNSHDNDRYPDMKLTSVKKFLTAQNVGKFM